MINMHDRIHPSEFPDLKGFSPQNLGLIRQFYVEYQHAPDLQQLVGEIPWGQVPEEYHGMLPTDDDWQRLMSRTD
jgi:predicted nuclease of restriction endonuclease-like (RecB) superfamily